MLLFVTVWNGYDLASGASDRKAVEVQVLSWSPYTARDWKDSVFFNFPIFSYFFFWGYCGATFSAKIQFADNSKLLTTDHLFITIQGVPQY